MLTDAERVALLRIARESVTAEVLGREGPPCDDAVCPVRAGAFVTLRRDGELRGCLGHLEADQPLPALVARLARAAATADPRFLPVGPAELPHVSLEISVLGPIEPVGDLQEIEVGRHGLVAESGRRRGLLLPQVAIEWRWDRDTFLAQTCVKAGLSPDAWRAGATILKFEAEVFGEEEPLPGAC